MRNQALDILRLVAVLAVFGRHMPLNTPADPVAQLWYELGWVGVDLFFVLSGFLVSGLLFADYSKLGRIRAGRFLIRRGLKIYPAFYVYLLTVISVLLLSGHPVSVRAILSEGLFVQNYAGFVWNKAVHTWSLAVEEHFYLLLLLAVVACVRRIHLIPYLMVSVCVACFVLRVWTLGPLTGDAIEMRHHFPTHLRLDSLAFGVLIRYWFHFYPERFLAIAARWRWLLVGVFVACMIPFLVRPTDLAFRYTIGFSLLYVGFGSLLAAVVGLPTSHNWLARLCAKLGSYSYSIYLWHMVVLVWVMPLVVGVVPIWLSYWRFAAIYIPLAIAWGVVMYLAVEWPILKLRDRKFR